MLTPHSLAVQRLMSATEGVVVGRGQDCRGGALTEASKSMAGKACKVAQYMAETVGVALEAHGAEVQHIANPPLRLLVFC